MLRNEYGENIPRFTDYHKWEESKTLIASWIYYACQIAPCKGIQTPESWALDSGILLTIGIQNPSSTDKESGIQFLDWNPWHGIQNPRLSWGAFLWDDPDQDHLWSEITWIIYCRSNNPMNPLWTRIHQFIWFTMIRVISDHWSWSGSSQKNAPLDSLTWGEC